jgi:hypothetical protein
MPKARTLPEATPHPDAEIQALAVEFEAALHAYQSFYHGSGTDDEAAAATNAVKAVAQKIVAVPGTDISTMRLKARVYLWAESTDVEKLAAEGGDWPSEAVLASLFRDLGVADVDATPGPATMADRAPARREEARSTAAPASDTEARGATSSANDWRLQIERAFDQAFGDWLRAKAKTFSGENGDVLERVDDEGEAERRLMATPALAPDQFWEKLAAFEAILDDELRANMPHSSILMLGLGSTKANLLNFRLCDREATR